MRVRDETAETPGETGAWRREGPEAYLQYVEGPEWRARPPGRKTSGQACRSGVSAVAVETFMNTAA
jgi:hypothetical protein